MSSRVLFAVLFVVTCVSCAVVPREHILMFDDDGVPIDPAAESWYGVYPRLLESDHEDFAVRPDLQFDRYLDHLLGNLETYVVATDNRRVLLFVHGGLNTNDSSIGRAADLSPTILESGAYPIFVNWRSNLFSSYADHLFFVRQGGEAFEGPGDVADDVFDSLRVLWTPFQFAGDLARGVLRLPITATFQLEETTEWLGWNNSPERDAADASLARWMAAPDDDVLLRFPVVDGTAASSDGATWYEEVGGFLRWIVFAGPKLLSTIAVDAAGTGSWDVMLRRVAHLFHPEHDVDADAEVRRPRGLLHAMHRLARLQEQHDLRITIVGHSMGAIVVNHLLQHATLQRRLARGFDYSTWVGRTPEIAALPRFENIVLLGAACSVRDYEDAVFPYLLDDRTARVFHVVLHPNNEIGEAPYYDLAPRGSLLTWIDDFLAKPTTPLDRTAGRYTNLLPALHHTPVELRGRIHLRILPWNDDGLPQRHGELSDALDAWNFWREEHWFPRGVAGG